MATVYAKRKVYYLPRSLEALSGPGICGVVHTDPFYYWAPGEKSLVLDSYGTIRSLYMAVLNEGDTAQIEQVVNKELLFLIWPALTLPQKLVQMWETKFPVLAEIKI